MHPHTWLMEGSTGNPFGIQLAIFIENVTLFKPKIPLSRMNHIKIHICTTKDCSRMFSAVLIIIMKN